MSSTVLASNLKAFLKPTSTKGGRHPSIRCFLYRLEVDDARRTEFQTYAGQALLRAYIDPAYLAPILEREGFAGVKRVLEEMFPPVDDPFGVRKGDFGEAIGHMVFLDLWSFSIPVFKLRYKTNREKTAFGVDIIAFRLVDADPSKDTVAFSEVKTSPDKHYGVKAVFDEVEALVAEGQPEAKQKMRNAVRFVSLRLSEQKQYELQRRIDRFLDCYTNPHFIEAFVPFLVRDKQTWKDDALDGIVLDKLNPNQVRLCVFLIANLEESIAAAYEMAIQAGVGIDQPGIPQQHH